MKKISNLFSIPYILWLFLFVLAPVVLIVWQSLFDIQGHLTLDNYQTFFSSWTYIRMSFNSIIFPWCISAKGGGEGYKYDFFFLFPVFFFELDDSES